MSAFETMLDEVRGCRMCAPLLPLGARPVLQASKAARILIASQAPGSKVHNSGIPFADRSGDRLRHWTGLPPSIFYDPEKVAIVPMAFCYPGRSAGGDMPPRSECAPLWRTRILSEMPEISVTLLVGSYAQAAALGSGRVEDRVRDFRNYLPRYFPLPHPSWRSQIWMQNNPWFEIDVLPELRSVVNQALLASES
ncbi:MULTISPECIES: uracil-DNA glycosylase family protein [unclassified Sphingopyxis]|uniref:uracil-DNA glycosylase family protein n=1 Tax=unclassified Sphingopyxis TaxID=2614943 RepID=UPI002858AF93|nr:MULTISPECIES: uracil-DNA glycosylase family protein [unclassified Sphingopyxis]MDR6834197.1 uracil-DNA glycosylase [Sphingopyxis sp. BE122]MDR7226467.1 uracil-DNA glycosylase [Sphingopyxis sp. BE259]